MKDPDSEEPGSTFEFACKPDSVPFPGTAIHLGRAITRRLVRPTRDLFDGQPSSLFGLAPGGVCQAGRSPGSLVGSYPTVSPLPVLALRRAIGGLFSVALSVGLPRLGVTQHRALWSPDFPRALQPAAVRRTRFHFTRWQEVGGPPGCLRSRR
jgi:hypothetical protein